MPRWIERLIGFAVFMALATGVTVSTWIVVALALSVFE